MFSHAVYTNASKLGLMTDVWIKCDELLEMLEFVSKCVKCTLKYKLTQIERNSVIQNFI